MNNVIIIYTDNRIEIEVDKEVSDIILNYLTTFGDWGQPDQLAEPKWGHSNIGEYRMYVSLVEKDALIANQELLGINVKLESKEVN